MRFLLFRKSGCFVLRHLSRSALQERHATAGVGGEQASAPTRARYVYLAASFEASGSDLKSEISDLRSCFSPLSFAATSDSDISRADSVFASARTGPASAFSNASVSSSDSASRS